MAHLDVDQRGIKGSDRFSACLGAHIGAQTRIIHRHPRKPNHFEYRRNTCPWVILGHAELLNLFTENPRVDGSIPPLATISNRVYTVYTGHMVYILYRPPVSGSTSFC